MLHSLFFFSPPILHEHTSAGLDGRLEVMTRGKWRYEKNLTIVIISHELPSNTVTCGFRAL